MPRKRSNHLSAFEKFFLGLAAVFLSVSILRAIQFEPFLKVQSIVQTFLTGQQSIEHAVQAIGSRTTPEHLQSVFSEWFPAASPTSEPVIESAPPVETLAATAAGVFPNKAESAVYPITLSCLQPVPGAVVTSRFGARIHPISGQNGFHKGIDLAAEQGSTIYALEDGTIRTAAQSGSYGNYLIVQHNDGVCSLYAHCDQLLAGQGDTVQAGDPIATVGATGDATGNHLHLELWRAGKLLNPEDYLEI